MGMQANQIVVFTDLSMIVCIVQRGHANEVVRAAVAAGAQGATVHYASGSGMRERLGLAGFAVETEKEVIQIAVPNESVDRIFEAMYVAGRLDTPGMGFIYVIPLDKAATAVPRAMLQRIRAQGIPA